MKIHNDDIDAAYEVINDIWKDVSRNLVKQALEEATKTRRARKQAKRERQRKEKDKQVVESINPQDYNSPQLMSKWDTAQGAIVATPSKAPEWDGTFYLGQWQTRDGSKVVLSEVDHHPVYPFTSEDGRTYDKCGFLYGPDNETPHDLIRPWPKGEK